MAFILLLLGSTSLLGGFGDFSTSFGLVDGLDDTDSDGLTHVADGETSKRSVIGKGFNAHGLGRDQFNDTGISRLEELGVVFDLLSGTAVNLLLEFGELAGDVGGVTIEDWSVSGGDLSGVVHDDNLGGEGLGFLGGVVLGVRADGSTTDVLDGNVLDVESNVVSGSGFRERFVMHLDGLDFSGQSLRSESDDHTGLDKTSFNTADGNSSNTSDLVHILEGKAERTVGGTLRREDGVKSLEEGLSGSVSFLAFNSPSLEPGHVAGGFKHVVSVESRDGDEGDSLWVVTDLLDEVGDFTGDFGVTGLTERRFGGVHLVAGNDELLNSESLSK